MTFISISMPEVMNVIDNGVGMLSLICASALILKPRNILDEKTEKEERNEIFFEILLAVIGKLIPFLGLLIGSVGFLGKSLEADEFLREEKQRNRRIVFIIALVCELVSVVLALLN